MKLLKHKLAWRRWAKLEGLTYQEPKISEPTAYPCYAYTSCRSFGYEELNEHYLYIKDLRGMLQKMAPEGFAHDICQCDNCSSSIGWLSFSDNRK